MILKYNNSILVALIEDNVQLVGYSSIVNQLRVFLGYWHL